MARGLGGKEYRGSLNLMLVANTVDWVTLAMPAAALAKPADSLVGK